MKAIIIGGGIGGLTTVLSLNKVGFEVKIFESVKEITPLGEGINTLPHCVRVLSNLGLEEKNAANAIETTDLIYYGNLLYQNKSGSVAEFSLARNSKQSFASKYKTVLTSKEDF